MKKYDAVRFAVRPRVIGKLLSQLYGLIGLLMLVPGAVAWATGSEWAALAYLGISLGVGLLAYLGRRLEPVGQLQRNEAAATVALLFVSASLVMSLPLLTYGIPFADAWFEAASGVTTTGLSTVSLADKPSAFLFARGWMQWLGGIGVVVLALALFVTPGRAAKSLGFSDAETSDVIGGTRAHARRVVAIYLALTSIGLVALLLAGASPLDAVVHCMTAVSTGGFANRGDSLASLGGAEVTVVSLLSIAGAVSYHVYYGSLLDLRRGRPLDRQFYALGALVVGVSLAVWVMAHLTDTELSAGEVATIVVSAQTTAGFSTTSVASLPAWLLLMLCVSMFIGGGVGSTSGGVKLGRVVLVVAWIRTYLVRTAMPVRVHVSTRVAGRRVEDADLEDVFAVVGLFFLVLVSSWLIFLAHGYPALPALFEIVSALSTTGLSAGVSDADLPTLLKVVLCADMLFGRVEVVALFLVLLPRTWIGRRRTAESRGVQ